MKPEHSPDIERNNDYMLSYVLRLLNLNYKILYGYQSPGRHLHSRCKNTHTHILTNFNIYPGNQLFKAGQSMYTEERLIVSHVY